MRRSAQVGCEIARAPLAGSARRRHDMCDLEFRWFLRVGVDWCLWRRHSRVFLEKVTGDALECV